MFGKLPIVAEIGLVSGTVTATQFPTGSCVMVNLKAAEGNSAGAVFRIGSSSNRMFWELGAGDETGWFYCPDLNLYWYQNLSGSTQRLSYWLLK